MGRLAGIARHAERRGPIELLESVEVTPEAGVAGDRNGGKSSRQVSLIEAGDWATAIAEVGADIPWWERRSNLLVEEIDLPHGGDVVNVLAREVRPGDLVVTMGCGDVWMLGDEVRAAIEGSAA